VIESTSLEIPVLNIGLRQQGREHASNVIDVPAERRTIRKALKRALSSEFKRSIHKLENPYGDGRAAVRILDVLTTTRLGTDLLLKTKGLSA
jgi:UDP-N-acetylglucosamine 2-epimerase